MKVSLITSAIALAALAILALSSCADLAGTSISFDPSTGAATITAPSRPITVEPRK
jgi:hypothetical protein